MLQLYIAHFTDEAPLIGSGFRLVWAKSGKKWAHLLYAPKATTVRILRDTWEEIDARPVDPSRGLRRLLKRNITAAERLPTKLERMVFTKKDEN